MRAIVTFILIPVAPILVQQQHHQDAHQQLVVAHVLLPIPLVLQLTADMLRLYTGKLIPYDVFIDTYTFCFLLAPAVDR